MSCSPVASSSSSSSSSSSRSAPVSANKARQSSSKQRRPSPLKRQMSLSSSDPHIDPFRTHSAGPLAVLYAAPAERDPLLNASSGRHTQSSPRRLFQDTSGDNNILGSLNGGTMPSPSRSLLSAFQAISPAAHGRSSTSMTNSLLSGGGGAIGLRSAGIAAGLQPASPILGSGGSPRRIASGHSRRNSAVNGINWASEAMRAANGASSPVRSLGNTPSGATRSPAQSPRRSVAPASPAASAVESEEPAWQIYRDPVASTSAVRLEDTSMHSLDQQEAEEAEADENAPLNDENTPLPENTEPAVPHLPLPTPRSVTASRNQRRSTLSNVLQPRAIEAEEGDVRRQREHTPPLQQQRAVDVFGTPITQTENSAGREEYDPDVNAGSEERRKRRRVSDVE